MTKRFDYEGREKSTILIRSTCAKRLLLRAKDVSACRMSCGERPVLVDCASVVPLEASTAAAPTGFIKNRRDSSLFIGHK
jgi:hypothetical protein